MNISETINQSISLYETGDFAKSLKILKSVLGKVGDSRILSIIYYNMGLCNYAMANYRASQNNYKKSIELGGDCQYELFLSLMHESNSDGANYWKFRCEGKRRSYPNLPIKRLEFDRDSDSVLVLNEQGLGDEILFSRQIKYLSQRYKNVSYQVYRESLELFKKYHNYGNVNFFTDRVLKYDFVMSHQHFALSGDFFFNWIDTEINPIVDIQPEYDVGFCWSANSKSQNAKLRSIDPNRIKPLLAGKSVLSLQYRESLDFTQYLEINNLLDTSNHILKCREIWTIDTVVAHLALMLGSNVTLLYRDYLDWRWKNNIYKNIKFLKLS